jgi:hypothetical protein
MGEERVCDIYRAMPALDEAMMRARAVVPDDDIAANLYQIA